MTTNTSLATINIMLDSDGIFLSATMLTIGEGGEWEPCDDHMAMTQDECVALMTKLTQEGTGFTITSL